MYTSDKRIVITLDAGGTNLVFGAMRGCEYITEPVTYPSNAHDLDLCLDTMLRGFREVISSLDEAPVAVSFAFPGPADYPTGIIGGTTAARHHIFPALLKEMRSSLATLGGDEVVEYDNMKRIGVTYSKHGASKAISTGAYAFALSKLDKKD